MLVKHPSIINNEKNTPKEVTQLLPNEKRIPKEQKICEDSDNGKEIC